MYQKPTKAVNRNNFMAKTSKRADVKFCVNMTLYHNNKSMWSLFDQEVIKKTFFFTAPWGKSKTSWWK